MLLVVTVLVTIGFAGLVTTGCLAVLLKATRLEVSADPERHTR